MCVILLCVIHTVCDFVIIIFRDKIHQLQTSMLSGTTTNFLAASTSRLPSLQIRGVISTFSWGPKFFSFFNATGLLKNWIKQHFICSNLTLFIVPFFLFFFFYLIFFSFFFFLFPWGATAPQPPQMRPLLQIYNIISIYPSHCFSPQIPPCTRSSNYANLF